jgi:hypothetical protein
LLDVLGISTGPSRIISSVSLARPKQNTKDGNGLLLMIDDKQEPVIADTSPKHTLPLAAAQRFHIGLKGVGLHLSKYTRHALLNGFGEAAKVLVGVLG